MSDPRRQWRRHFRLRRCRGPSRRRLRRRRRYPRHRSRRRLFRRCRRRDRRFFTYLHAALFTTIVDLVYAVLADFQNLFFSNFRNFRFPRISNFKEIVRARERERDIFSTALSREGRDCVIVNRLCFRVVTLINCRGVSLVRVFHTDTNYILESRVCIFFSQECVNDRRGGK